VKITKVLDFEMTDLEKKKNETSWGRSSKLLRDRVVTEAKNLFQFKVL